MARTDAHDPMWVRMMDPHRSRAIHDHAAGPCDLLPLHEWAKVQPGWREVRCRWDLTLAEYYENPVCGCALCSAQGDRKQARRKERHGARKVIDDGFGDWMADLADEQAERDHADYEAEVAVKWDEIMGMADRYRQREELVEQREAQLRDFMETVPGVTPRQFVP